MGGGFLSVSTHWMNDLQTVDWGVVIWNVYIMYRSAKEKKKKKKEKKKRKKVSFYFKL